MALVAHYKLETNCDDSTKYKNTANSNNINWLSNGSIKYCYFNNSFIHIPDQPYLNTDGPYDNKTISFMLNIKNVNPQQLLYKQGHQNVGILVYVYNRYLYIGGYNVLNNWNGTYFSAIINPEKWYCLFIKLESGSVFSSYLNGTCIGKDTNASNLLSHNDIYLGGKNNISRFHFDFYDQDNSDYLFEGSIIDFKQYNIAVPYEFIVEYSRNMLPTTQIVSPKSLKHVEAHNERIYQFGETNVYLTRDINYLLHVLGNDIVLDGVYVENLIKQNNEFVVSLNNGILIQDSTLIEITDNNNISTPIVDYGVYVLYTEFVFSESYETNTFKIYFEYFNSLVWDSRKNRIVLAIVYYDENESFYMYSGDYIYIDDILYYVRGISNFNMLDLIHETIKHKNVFTLSNINIINTASPNHGEIKKDKKNVIFSKNGNLIFSNTQSYYNTQFFIQQNKHFTDQQTDVKYEIFNDNGNLIIAEQITENTIENKTNVQDLGEMIEFLQTEHSIKINNKNLILTNPQYIHNM